MGFSFKGLTSSALASNNTATTNAANTDVADAPRSVAGHTSMDAARPQPDDKMGAPHASSVDPNDSEDELTKIDTTAPSGVQNVQAASHVWSKTELIIAYILMWFMAFVLAFTSSTISTLSPYVTSSFEQHSLTALTSVISSLIAGLWKLPYAKIMTIWGRPQALCLGITSCVIGLIMMATCENVQTYCAAQTFWNVGYNSVDFSITVFIADTSKLRNRAFFIGYSGSPWLITTWVYGLAVDSIVAPNGIGLHWGFGVFAFILPVFCSPLAILYFVKQAQARKQGLIEPRPNHGNAAQTCYHYAREFDVIGILILATGLAIFLLAFNLYSYQADTWRSPMIICFIIFGVLLIIAFGLWEKYIAPATFIPWNLLKNRTVIFTYCMAFTLYIGWYTWNSYFYSLLIVLYNQPVLYATYINNTYTMGSCTCCIIYGLALRHYGKLKVYSLVAGVPLTMLGVGLMLAFLDANANIGYIVMCLVFIAFGGGILVTSEQTTLMAVSQQQDFPALLAVESMLISIGGAIGSTIAGAIWTGVFPVRLMTNLPDSAMDQFTEIYGDLDTQSGFPRGSETRTAIDTSYAETQRYLLIAAVCIYSLTFVSVIGWQNIDTKKQRQRTVGLL